MILVDLSITDYKQFAGTHRFTPSPHGLVAIIGTNGAGKTTLFEAIEWCLFQPREIPSAEVPPRAGTGSTRVVLTLLDPHSGDLYTVERRLKSNGLAQAEIARGEGDDREVIVTGTRPVTEYVWRTLIGLDHRAFVATFFTRQKELSFFGDSRPTERRREVQRLLGLETIRKAQESLAEERRRAASQAEALLAQVDETAASRDFEAELAEASATVASAQQAVAARRAEVQRDETAHQGAQRALEQLTELQRQDTALATELARLTAETSNAAKATQAAEAEIARLDGLAATRGEIERLATTADDLRRQVDALEVVRERHDRLAQATREVEAARRQIGAEIDEMRRLVASSPHASAAWLWPAEGHVDPTATIDALLAVAQELSIPRRERHLSLLESAREQRHRLSEAEAEVSRFQSKLDDLRAEREEHFRSGDPDDEIADFDRREREIDARVEQQRTTIRLLSETLQRLDELAGRLAGQDFTGLCPTCGRPFTAHDALTSEEHARLQVHEHRAHIATLEVDVVALAARRVVLADSRTAAQARRVGIEAVTRRIENGDGMLLGKREALAQLQATTLVTLDELGRSDNPSDDEIDDARHLLAAERAVQEAVVSIRGRRAAVAGHMERVSEGESIRADLGEVAFEPGALVAAREGLQQATSAAARLAEIDQRLARRPEFVVAREESILAVATAQAAHVEVEGRRATLDFQATALKKARMALDDAVEDERNARSRLSAAEVEHQAGVGRVQQVERERELFRAVAERADERARERDVLDEMVKEFNGFDRFVTQRVRPQMEDLTSELVRIVTDDKYQEVSLDDDYGVHVVAGGLDHFPLEQFSGGERDVVALCARLALSRIIGAQAVNPPRFLVLDEVFGSLDRERRLSLLEMLSNLAGSADVFQQLFVISHIDDVRTSSAFSEVWRVVEQVDGSSRLENLNLTGGAEEL